MLSEQTNEAQGNQPTLYKTLIDLASDKFSPYEQTIVLKIVTEALSQAKEPQGFETSQLSLLQVFIFAR